MRMNCERVDGKINRGVWEGIHGATAKIEEYLGDSMEI